MESKIKVLTESNFQAEVLNHKGLVVVDFTATWCGPCKMLLPVMEDVAQHVKVCKVDIEDCPITTRTYSVSAVPTLLFFKNGEMLRKLVGLQPKPLIMDEVARFKADGPVAPPKEAVVEADTPADPPKEAAVEADASAAPSKEAAVEAGAPGALSS